MRGVTAEIAGMNGLTSVILKEHVPVILRYESCCYRMEIEFLCPHSSQWYGLGSRVFGLARAKQNAMRAQLYCRLLLGAPNVVVQLNSAFRHVMLANKQGWLKKRRRVNQTLVDIGSETVNCSLVLGDHLYALYYMPLPPTG